MMRSRSTRRISASTGTPRIRPALSEELEALTQSLSITTFRYAPRELRADPASADYLNTLNTTLLARLQAEGKVYVSNALIGDVFALRACIVNFRTTSADIRAVIDATVEAGRMLDRELRVGHR